MDNETKDQIPAYKSAEGKQAVDHQKVCVAAMNEKPKK